MLSWIRKQLDAVTMYRVVIYSLCAIIAAGFVLSLSGVLYITPIPYILSLSLIVGVVLLVHELCVKVSGAPGNIESSLITALILFLILTPAATVRDAGSIAFIAGLAILFKYTIVHRLRHLFNPAALALFVAGLMGFIGVEWWVSSRYLLPVVAIAGALVAMKTRRESLVLTYLAASTAVVVAWFLFTASMPPFDTIMQHFLSWPTVFFATIMLTEPLSLPSTRWRQYVYAVLAAVVGGIPFSFGALHGTPELSLLVANLFTFIVDRPERMALVYVGRTEVGKDTFEYRFRAGHPVFYKPGQYLEWTLPHAAPDSRGIRRYFTISAGPGSEYLSFSVRHLPEQSSWKKTLASMTEGTVIFATQRSGDFTLSAEAPLHVWIAGGIGITPYMSMMRDANNRGAQIPAVLFYCNKTEGDIAFKDELEKAPAGVRVVHVLAEKPASGMIAETGFVTREMIERNAPGWQGATFYLSGPPGMVASYEKLLQGMGVRDQQIITDYFPGLA